MAAGHCSVKDCGASSQKDPKGGLRCSKWFNVNHRGSMWEDLIYKRDANADERGKNTCETCGNNGRISAKRKAGFVQFKEYTTLETFAEELGLKTQSHGKFKKVPFTAYHVQGKTQDYYRGKAADHANAKFFFKGCKWWDVKKWQDTDTPVFELHEGQGTEGKDKEQFETYDDVNAYNITEERCIPLEKILVKKMMNEAAEQNNKISTIQKNEIRELKDIIINMHKTFNAMTSQPMPAEDGNDLKTLLGTQAAMITKLEMKKLEDLRDPRPQADEKSRITAKERRLAETMP